MKTEIADKALDLFFNKGIFSFNQRPQISIFGGEPSLFPSIVRHIASRASSACRVPLDFSLVTNGYELSEEFLEVLAEFGFHVTVSIDGPPEVHDKQRRGLRNDPTFRKIERNVRRLLDIRRRGLLQSLNAEVTITVNSLRHGRIVDIVAFSKKLGFDSVIVHPASLPPGSSLRAPPDEFQEQIVELHKYVLNSLLTCSPLIEQVTLMSLLSTLQPGDRSCGAGSELFAVEPQGDIYPCQTLVGVADLRIGNVLTPGTTKFLAVKNKLERAQKRWNPICEKCAVRVHCPNVCYAHNLIERGDIGSFPSDYCIAIESMFAYTQRFLANVCRDDLKRALFVNSLSRLLKTRQRKDEKE